MIGWTLGRRLHLMAGASLAAILAERGTTFAVAGIALLFLVAVRPTALRPLGTRTFALFAILSLGFGAWLLGPVPLRFSGEGLLLGGTLVARAAVVIALARWAVLDASAFEFAGLLPGRRGATFGFALGIALNALPALEDSGRRTWDALRTRGATGRHRAKNLRRFAIVTLGNALRRADATAEVALSRDYSLDRLREGRPSKAEWRLGVAIILVVADGLVLAIVISRFA